MIEDPSITIAVYAIIAAVPVLLLVFAFISALGKQPGNRRRSVDMNYTGPERRCHYRKSSPVGDVCRDPQRCIFFEARRDYLDTLNLRNDLPNDVNPPRHSVE